LSGLKYVPLTPFVVRICNVLIQATAISLQLPFTLERVHSGVFGWGTSPQAGRSRARFPLGSLEFIIALLLPAALWPWGRLTLWQKWEPGVSPEE